MNDTEVEIRSFVNKQKFEELKKYFKKNAKFIKEDFQESHYLDTEQDLRIQKNDYHSKIWLKNGSMHDDWRKETEVKFDKSEFDNLVDIFKAININTKIKWFRQRFEYDWDGIKVDLDYTKGYGYIIELEKMSTKKDAKKIHSLLTDKMNDLDIKISSKDEFSKKFKYYEENWQELTA